jgi:hypothetical protein
MKVRTHLISCATIVSLVTLVAAPAFAVIELPRGTKLVFRWDPAPGPVDLYAVYAYCNGGEGVLSGIVFQNIASVPSRFCDTLVVRVSAYRSGADGGEGPLSEPSELIRFAGEEDAGGAGSAGGGVSPDDLPSPDGSADAGVLLDFDGDRKSDILVQNAETGELELWTLEGGQAMAISALPPLASGARVVGNGDMNGDGSADLLYLNGETGELGVWLIAGAAVIGGGAIADLAPDWDVIGNGDHDGDGRADVLLQNQSSGELELWTMNGPEILEAGPLSHVHGAGWKVAATGDYDGDGRADLLWHDPDAGQIDIWLMDERTLAADRTITTGLSDAWSIVAAGDFDGDRQGDIVWRNRMSGALGIWFLDAGGLRSQSALDPKRRRRVPIVGAGDYDGDGLLDLLAHLSDRGRKLRALFTNGSEILDNVSIADLPPPWFVAGVGERSPMP